METEFRITNEGELVLVELFANGEPMCCENGGAEIFDYWFLHQEDGIQAALWYDKCLLNAKNKPVLDVSNIPRLIDGDMMDLSHPENLSHPEQWDEMKDLLN